MIHYLKRAYYRIKRFIVWFPVIWKDEDWQPQDLYEIMRFKIFMMRKETQEDAHFIGWEKNVRMMKVVEQLLARQAYDPIDFYNTLEEKLEDEEKKGKCKCPEELYTWEDVGNGCSKMNSHFCEFCDRNLKRWHKRALDKQKADRDYIWELLRKHADKWWT